MRTHRAASNRGLLGSVAIATLAASLFWTGFPVFILNLANAASKSRFSLSEIYAFAVAGSFVFSAISGRWADNGRHREMAIASQFGSAGLVVAIACLCAAGADTGALFLLPLVYFNFAFGGVMESVWLFERSENNDLKNRVVNRGVVLTGMKIVGFALGPFCFGAFGFITLAICAALFVSASLIQLSIREPDDLNKQVATPERKVASLFKIAKESNAFWAGLLTGFLSVPLNPIFAGRGLYFGGNFAASCFWFCAGIASISGMLIIKRFEIAGSFRQMLLATVVMIFAMSGAMLFQNVVLVIAFASLYVLCVPLFSVQLQIRILQNSRDVAGETLGARVGYLAFILDGGIFLGMAAAAATERFGLIVQLIAIAFFLVLRLQCFANRDDRQ